MFSFKPTDREFSQKILDEANKHPKIAWAKDSDFIRFFAILCESDRFDFFMMFLVLLNTIVLSIKYPDMSSNLEDLLDNINHGFTILFLFECFIKFAAWG